MARYQVRAGEVLPVNGQVVEAGAYVDLPRAVAEDTANRHRLQEVDADGKPVDPPAVDDLERFRAHERVGFLRERLAEAQAKVDAIQAQLAREEQALAEAVRALQQPAKGKKTTAAPDAGAAPQA